MSVVGFGDGAHERLGRALDDTATWLDRAQSNLGAAPSAVRIAPADATAALVDDMVLTLRRDTNSLLHDVGSFAAVTRLAGLAYSKTEQMLQEAFSQGVQSAMHLFGLMLRPYVPLVIAGAVGGGALIAALDRLTRGAAVRTALELALRPVVAKLDLIKQSLTAAYGPYLESVLSDPKVLKLLGYGARGIDDFLVGLFGVPRLQAVSDNDAVKILVAALLPIIANGHRLGSNPVTPRDTTTHELAERGEPEAPISQYSEGFEQIIDQESDIVVHTYVLADGTRHHQVFSKGTQNWSMGEEESGYDTLSNVENAVSGAELYGTAHGLHEALLAAGVEPGESVDFFGYSQGGAAVAQVAAAGVFDVQSVTTYAGPIGMVETSEDLNMVQVQVNQDSIPIVAGMSQHRSPALILEVSVDIDPETPFDYHLQDAYRQAIQQVEASGDTVALQQVRDRAEMLEGAEYQGQRAFELDR